MPQNNIKTSSSESRPEQKHKKFVHLERIATQFSAEIRRILSDRGVILVFFAAGLIYPILYSFIYNKEVLRDVPVAIVDQSQCPESRRFITKIDATPDMRIDYKCATIDEAKRLMQDRKINGIIYFPSDYGEKLANREQARIVIFCDMSSFLFYKNVLLGNNMVMLDEMKNIQIERYGKLGITGEYAQDLVTPVQYKEVGLFAPNMGFATFLIPAILVLIIHQTLFFGIGMSAATYREEGTEHTLLPANLNARSAIDYTIGRNLTYFCIYFFIAPYALIIVPHLFKYPQVGSMIENCAFLLPFMLASINFALTCSVFVRNRESGLLSLVFFSIILLFLSGFAWPKSNIPTFWRYFSYIFPSTHGIQGYIRINSMGATLQQVKFEYIALWAQTIFYFITACLSTLVIKHRNN